MRDKHRACADRSFWRSSLLRSQALWLLSRLGTQTTRLQSFDSGLTGRFIASFTDLNGDGKPEAIVHLTSNEWCGSGGCTTLVLVPDDDSWRVLSEISISRPPIRVLSTKSNGWRSIGVWVQGGGIQIGYEAELRFDGKKYPANPSVAPARPIVGKIEGEVVIPASIGR